MAMFPKICLFISMLLISVRVFAQKELVQELEKLVEKAEYEKVINEYAERSKEYPAAALYYIGLSYYMKEDDQHCLQFMERCLKKDPKYTEAYYIKASTLNYLEKYEEAAQSFLQAISLNPYRADYYSGLGDAYYQQSKDSLALQAYIKATKQPSPPGQPFSMIAQIYSEQKKNDLALDAFYQAKSHHKHDSPSYINALFNIGLLEYLRGNDSLAEVAYLELLSLAPDDFHTCAKLVQVYHHRKTYEKALPYQEKLREAHKKGLLKDHLADKYCFDQFTWKDKSVQAYERYESGESENLYIKHIFYVINAQEEIEYTIQTEYSPMTVELGSAPYVLCMQRGKEHATFNRAFAWPVNYEELKKAVVDVLEGKIKPGGSSRPGK
jgi:tetratricopeptide (TPR) repeat protein